MKRKLRAVFVLLVPAFFLMVSAGNAAILPSDYGWTLVRRVEPGLTWHPADDNLAGTAVYGTLGSETANSTFSINFELAVANWDQIMFITGDRERWMVMNKTEISKTANNDPLEILSSYLNLSTHTHLMYNRGAGFPEDPWLSALDHSDSINSGNILYGEKSFAGAHASTILPIYNGANVFVRNSELASVPEPTTLAIWSLLGGIGLVVGHRRRKRKAA